MAKDYETSRRNYEEYDPADEEPSWVETTKRHRKRYATLPVGRPKGPQKLMVVCPCGAHFRNQSQAQRLHKKVFPALCRRRAH